MGKRKDIGELLKLSNKERRKLREDEEEAHKEESVMIFITVLVMIAGLIVVLAIFGSLAEVAAWMAK